ncbi:MAG: hypothetical protein ACRBK7_31225 [Acidimicrobiales bacterium]
MAIAVEVEVVAAVVDGCVPSSVETLSTGASSAIGDPVVAVSAIPVSKAALSRATPSVASTVASAESAVVPPPQALANANSATSMIQSGDR